MTAKFYLLRPFTNLHVGSGEANFSVIDNLIERDPASGFPCINSSGLKGALKQHFVGCDPSINLRRIFGSDAEANKRGKSGDAGQGECFFLPAQLLALPVRTDKTPFILCTSPALLGQFLSTYKDLTSTNHPYKDAIEKFGKLISDNSSAFTLKNNFKDADLGSSGLKIKNCTSPLGEADQSDIMKIFSDTKHSVGILPDEILIKLCNDLNLPVIARNVLVDGESKNLWYEQVLPRESLLYFPIVWKDDLLTDEVKKAMQKPVQIGGNASVGYGFTKITEL